MLFLCYRYRLCSSKKEGQYPKWSKNPPWNNGLAPPTGEWKRGTKQLLNKQRNLGKFSVDQGGRRSGGNLLRQNSEAGFEACITKILARQFLFHQLIPVPHVRSRNIQSMQRYIILDEESHEDVERERLASFEMVRPPMDPSSSEAFSVPL